jgi:hypothetical protein
MALLRVWVSGGGNLNFAAWFSIGVFLGLLYRHDGEQVATEPVVVAGGRPSVPGLREPRSPYR